MLGWVCGQTVHAVLRECAHQPATTSGRGQGNYKCANRSSHCRSHHSQDTLPHAEVVPRPQSREFLRDDQVLAFLWIQMVLSDNVPMCSGKSEFYNDLVDILVLCITSLWHESYRIFNALWWELDVSRCNNSVIHPTRQASLEIVGMPFRP